MANLRITPFIHVEKHDTKLTSKQEVQEIEDERLLLSAAVLVEWRKWQRRAELLATIKIDRQLNLRLQGIAIETVAAIRDAELVKMPWQFASLSWVEMTPRPMFFIEGCPPGEPSRNDFPF